LTNSKNSLKVYNMLFYEEIDMEYSYLCECDLPDCHLKIEDEAWEDMHASIPTLIRSTGREFIIHPDCLSLSRYIALEIREKCVRAMMK
jgi:hypothetical protein